MVVAKLNYNGDTLFTKKYALQGSSITITDFTSTTDGGYLAGASNGYVYRLNALGDTLWSKKIINGGNSLSSSLNYFYMAEKYGQKIYKVDFNGTLLWNAEVSTIADDDIMQIKASADGGVMAMCTTFVADNHSLFVKLDENGNVYNNSIKGKVYKDANDNCALDFGEAPLKGILVEVLPGSLYGFTDSSGNYQIAVDTGIFYSVTSHISTLKLMENNCTTSYPISFHVKGKDSLSNDFAIHPVSCPDISAYFISGYNVTYCIKQNNSIVCSNIGNITAQDVSVSLEIPSDYVVLGTSIPFVQTNNKLTFTIGALPVGKDTVISIKSRIGCNISSIDDIEYFRTIAHTSTTCTYPSLSDDTTIAAIHIIDSFDPNDKQVFPSVINFNEYNQGKKELHYTIRFQNTGTSPAVTINIIDTLSPMLDLTSIRNVVVSHPASLEIINGNQTVVEWSFHNINLPYASEDSANSIGFISFVIDLKEGLSDLTNVTNKAAIYFDYNTPVITNAAIVEISSSENTEVYKENLTTSILSSSYSSSNNYVVTVMPNPVSETAEITLVPEINNASLSLFNSKGTKIRELTMLNGKAILEKQGLSPDIYYYQIVNKKGVLGTGKIAVR